MNSAELLAKIASEKQDIAAVLQYFTYLFPKLTPPEPLQIKMWLNRHDLDTIVYGLNAVGTALNKRLTLSPPPPSNGKQGKLSAMPAPVCSKGMTNEFETSALGPMRPPYGNQRQ